MPTVIDDNPDPGDWDSIAIDIDDLLLEDYYSSSDLRAIRFSSAIEAAAYAIDSGISGFSIIVEIDFGEYGVYVGYNEFA